jgi:hypothetical protein
MNLKEIKVASYPKPAETVGTPVYAADRALYAMKEKQSNAACAGLIS